MSKANKKKQRSKSYTKAIVAFIVISITVLVIAFLVWRSSLLNSTSFEREIKYGAQTGDYDNLQGEISRFFTAVHDAAWARDRKRKWILDIDLSDRSLLNELDQKARIIGDPVTLEWRGAVKTRWFMADDTLKTNAERIAAEEDMELIWWLDKDYVVRAAFQVHANIIQTLDRLARSLNSQHPGNVQAYLCPRQRVILIADRDAVESVLHYCTAVEAIRLLERQAN